MTELPTSGAPEVVYREGLSAGELRYQRCRGCTTAVFPPRVLCPGCGGEELAWHRSAGRGTTYSTTAVRSRAGAHNVVLVDLDEGFRMMSRVDGVEPDAVTIGGRLDFAVVEEAGEPVAVFREVRS
ncbi:Zn-ribbon domain-containing OB-fold protein [Saccharopolyspora sp. CA-218241]|uniref:Zn-ribbon domain-containing OB-fold protein n=1 Tax=Saccharopolyspora sp. CA-218241 TaxID=3240027 RepID=UPI003D99B408